MGETTFSVVVFRNWCVNEKSFRMGLNALYDEPDVNVEFLRDRGGPTESVPSEALQQADAAVALVDDVDEDSLAGVTDLQIIAKYGAGFDNIDVKACTARGIPVTNAPQAPTDSVAQATLGLIIACAHNLKRYDQLLHEQGFDGPVLENIGTELAEKTLGVVGLGRIGQRVLEIAEAFGIEGIVHDPYLSRERADKLGVERVALDTLFESADVVSLHCPLTEETRGMVTEAHFRRMKPSAYLVNTTRGGIYSDEVLARAVREEWIAGAAVDVFENESNATDNPLLELPDVLATPHIAGLTEETLTEYGRLCADAILDVKNGDVPYNVINPDAFETEVPPEKRSPSFRG